MAERHTEAGREQPARAERSGNSEDQPNRGVEAAEDRAAHADSPAPHIIDRLIELGITEGEMAARPLSWGEIVAWQHATMVRLPPWEARLLRRLSAAYVAESRLAESENRPAPYHTGPDPRAIETEQARLMAVLG